MPIGVGEAGVVRPYWRVQLALDDVRGDPGPGHLARERPRRVQLLAGGRRIAVQRLCDETGRATATLDQVGRTGRDDLGDPRSRRAVRLQNSKPAIRRVDPAV